jgi:hypothetical protein
MNCCKSKAWDGNRGCLSLREVEYLPMSEAMGDVFQHLEDDGAGQDSET